MCTCTTLIFIVKISVFLWAACLDLESDKPQSSIFRVLCECRVKGEIANEDKGSKPGDKAKNYLSKYAGYPFKNLLIRSI